MTFSQTAIHLDTSKDMVREHGCCESTIMRVVCNICSTI